MAIRYWTTACRNCAIKDRCTTGKERRITRWAHEHVLEAVQRRLDEHPEKMRQRRETVEHPFGTIKSWMGATHFQIKTLQRVGTEMALHVLAYNLKRVMAILGIGPLIAAISASLGARRPRFCARITSENRNIRPINPLLPQISKISENPSRQVIQTHHLGTQKNPQAY